MTTKAPTLEDEVKMLKIMIKKMGEQLKLYGAVIASMQQDAKKSQVVNKSLNRAFNESRRKL